MMRIAVLALFTVAPLASAADKKPNVLFLFTDDQRADTIAALGNPIIKTPNLDRLAQGGMVFANAYCMGSTMPAVCNPSRHMTLSGRSLYRYDPKDAEGTFGQTFRKAGWQTYSDSKGGNVAKVYQDAFEISRYLNDQAARTSGHHGRDEADHAIEFLAKRDRERPFFMYVAFAGPHDPRVAAEQWLNLYKRDDLPLPANFKPHHPFDNGDLLIRDEQLAPWPRTPEIVRKHLHDYYGCISSIDSNIGRILKSLTDSGDLENTIIVFSSDHGLAIGSHGLFGKQSLYEHSMKAPLFFTGPGVPKGKTAAPAYLFDIFPTVCELAGIPVPAKVEGKSLAPVIRGTAPQVRDTVFLSYMKVMRSVRVGDWKLIRYPQVGVNQLFNLADDPHELKNLAAEPEHAERLKQMTDRLIEQQKAWGDTLPLSVDKPKTAELDLSFFKAPATKTKTKKKKSDGD